jgi:hypothetical protein
LAWALPVNGIDKPIMIDVDIWNPALASVVDDVFELQS